MAIEKQNKILPQQNIILLCILERMGFDPDRLPLLRGKTGKS
jgi:hypothetical protein